MMKNMFLEILEKYLQLFPEEVERQKLLINFLNSHEDNDITDWNNFDGHIVAGGFIYAKKENVFLVLYHNDLKIYLYPGGHIEKNDKNPLDSSRREILEETGLSKLRQVKLEDNELIPIDIDTHVIEYSLKLDSNPEFTASVIVAYARAAYRLSNEGVIGCKTVFDIAPAYLSAKSGEELRATLL